MSAAVVAQDLVTAWGTGVESCWQGALRGQSAFTRVDRFKTDAFQAHLAALVPGLDPTFLDSLVMQMLGPLLAPLAGRLPQRTLVLLASTTGEVDLLERSLLSGEVSVEPHASGLDRLAGRVARAVGIQEPGWVVSAACASSTVAVAQAASLIASGARDAVLVVACDAVTEFVYAGFSSLMALDPDGARPFDRTRKGLTIGEAAGYVLLMNSEHAQREGWRVMGAVEGWGLSCDANHMTGPSRDGAGLTRAVRWALERAGVAPGAVASVSAHGTGTVYNDAMEIKAFQTVFAGAPVPVYSLKGGVGHTMGAAGLVQTIMALRSLREGVVPPSSNLGEADPEAEGWVTRVPTPMPDRAMALSTNSGFGGVNAALVLSCQDRRGARAPRPCGETVEQAVGS